MNQKELREIRKRFTLDKDSISHVYGCYVNAAKDIVARMDMSMGLMEQEEDVLSYALFPQFARKFMVRWERTCWISSFPRNRWRTAMSTGFYRLSGSPIFEMKI